MGPALGFPIETENIFTMSTVKVFQKLLDTASNFINVKTNINTLDLSKPNKNQILSSGLTLPKTEIKYIIKVIRCLENRRVLLKGTNKKLLSKEGAFRNCLGPLVGADLPLIKTNYLGPWLKVFCYH